MATSRIASKLGSKGAKRPADKKKAVEYLKTIIPAGKASPSPPLGPALGQRGINSGQFSKEFNERTKSLKTGLPIPTRIAIMPDRTYSFTTNTPTVTYFLKAAAGIEKGASNQRTEVAGHVTLKHIYEIALIKSQDEAFKRVPLESVCRCIIGSAKSIGIKITER